MSTNYHNPLAVIDTSNLSELGQQQVSEYIEFLRPRYEAIVNGETSKEEVARYYLQWEGKYTDGAKARINSINDAMRISKGYLSKIRNADKLLDTHQHNEQLCGWINEHPVTVRYQLGKISTEEMLSKYHTGEHYTRSELEKVSRETKEIKPAPEPVKTDYQLKLERAKQLVEDSSYRYITKLDFATTFMEGTTNSCLASAMEKVSRLTTCDEQREKQLKHLIKLCEEALKLPKHYQVKSLTEV